jgi:hypothetical protein
MRLIFRLMAVLGKRTFLTFGVVTLLVGGLLAATELTSRYALKLFAEDQLRRIPWDIAVYQRGGVTLENEVPNRMRSVENVRRVESLAFLRASFPAEGQVASEVDGKPLATPWICMIASSDPSLLPPKFRFAMQDANQPEQHPEDSSQSGVIALVGPERAISRAFVGLQGARRFDIHVNVATEKRELFSLPIHGVVREERDELNRWFMDEIGSIAFVPYISTILLTSYQSAALTKFDSVATGVVPMELIGPAESQYGHVEPAEYEAEVIYTAQVNRQKLISGWDISASLLRMTALRDNLQQAIDALGSTQLNVDSTTLVLLERMNRIARLIGIVTVLIALPLLWMAWVLAANLSGLLMLNERRKLGLMRLRGVPSHLMGRAIMLSVVLGGLVGGVLGLTLGSVVPALVYEHGHLLSGEIFQRQQLLLLLAFLLITLVLALEVSRRFILYATTISPLEASGRIAATEAESSAVRFGLFQFVALALGAYKLYSWIIGLSVSPAHAILQTADRGLDFVGLPLLLYGVSTLLVSRKKWIQVLLAPIVKPIGGRLGKFSLRQIAVKPHRTAAFLFIVALMTSVSIYPIVAARSFQEKAERGAKVNLGADWQFIFNSPDLAAVEQLQGSLGDQMKAILPGVERLKSSMSHVPGVGSTSFIVESILPSFYLPGYGLRGVPLYLLVDSGAYLKNTYSEPELGLGDKFGEILDRFANGEIAISQPISDFWQVSSGKSLILGRDDQQRTVSAGVGGVLAFLPGMPPQSVSDRQGYIQERVDYLNSLFQNNAYLAGAADAPKVAGMRVLIPRVIMLVAQDESIPAGDVEENLRRALPFPPLEMHSLKDEVRKTGSDMFIFLALENMRIYLVGGLLLALIGIVAMATANYMEEQHTLALLRIRGTAPKYIWRYLMAMFVSPALLGVILGGSAALVTGFGLADYLWKLREIQTVVGYLRTHMVISSLVVEIILLILALLVCVATGFNAWVFRASAREHIQKG